MRLDNPQLSGSILVTGSTSIIGDISVTGTIQGNIQSTTPLTASYILGSNIAGTVLAATSASYAETADNSNTSTQAISASYALTASYALNAGGGAGAGFPYEGAAVITGSLFVSGGNISGSFVGNGSQLTGITVSEFTTFEDTFTNVPSHSAVHNFGTKNVFVQVFEDDDTLIIPESIITTTTNQVDIVLGGTISGRVVIGKAGHLLQDTGNFSASTTSVETFTNALTASIVHNLASENVITQVFDLNGNVIVPSNIKVQDANNVKITFSTPRSGKAVIVKAGHIIQRTLDTQVSASFATTASYVAQVLSSSYATTASYALNAQIDTTQFLQTSLTSSMSVLSSSYATTATTASYALYAVSASHEITLETSSSYANLSTISETVQETRVGTALSFWQGTQAQYDALGSYDADTIYLVE